MSEALAEILAYGFKVMNLDIVGAQVVAKNTAINKEKAFREIKNGREIRVEEFELVRSNFG